MSIPYMTYALIILGTVIIGLLRIMLGPTRADRMLAAQLCGTASVAIFLLLAYAFQENYLFDMAMIFALLTAVASITFVRLTWQKTGEGQE